MTSNRLFLPVKFTACLSPMMHNEALSFFPLSGVKRQLKNIYWARAPVNISSKDSPTADSPDVI